MEISKKNKKVIMWILIFVFIIGIWALIYYKNQYTESVNINSFLSQGTHIMQEEELANNGGNSVKNGGTNSEKNSGDKVEYGEGNNNNNAELRGNESSINGSQENNQNSTSPNIYIHIIGEVQNEGIIILKEGERIVDAIEKAGGATECADLSKINLAFVLSDGQKLRIPSIYDKPDELFGVVEGSGNSVTDGSGNNINISAGNSGNGSGKNAVNKVNINSATQTELETLNGIGPSLAAKIIEYRNKNGKFNSIDELMNVSGIGSSKLEGIRDSVVLK
ncbi:MAG: helix-hairpin-helix domain-containing protein [Clostridia bacterium]|nr:helix-hairpin-helix domain-containing protein [Clostridia bacterium]